MIRRVLLLAFLALVCLPGPARAEPFADAVQALSAKGFRERTEAVEALAATGDARAVAILEALSEGALQTTADDRVVMVRGGTAVDAATGEVLAEPGPLNRITVNNSLRRAIRESLGRLGLFAAEPARRQAAAEALLNTQPSQESAAMLREALANESERRVRSAMEFSLAAMDLVAEDKTQRLEAIEVLSGSLDRRVRSMLQGRLAQEEDAEVRAAVEDALESIQTQVKVINFVSNLFQGLSLGSVLLLAAIGLAVTFGVMGVINMAHGEMIMLGAYTTFVVQEIFRAALPTAAFDLYLVVALPVAFAVTFLVGVGLERGIIRFLYGRPLETLLATWGISLALQQVVRSIFGATNKEVANPSWMTGGVEVVGGLMLTYNRIVIVLFALAVLAGLAALLRWSSFGLHMRAVTQNRPMASAMGIRTGRVDAMTFGLGSGIAGIAGVALSQIGNVSPNLGQAYIVDSFMVVVFGGVGSLWGTLVGAMSLGMVNKFLEPYAGAMLGKILVLVAIILFIQKRPRGLFALKGRSVEN
ncbi:urea ABC transporter permease subunit UrtB [Telmatospirillum sp. J64-1]|uniref:urea ABC transporter permease subunit UrtB n=1 Tax=Telmatospirillum sp. J64-1 TaxID=2502183 RepID=UPI00115C9077|nr:urea ABC transporter permease subunit UrtB [Telmatospirillum sp. J64-1]